MWLKRNVEIKKLQLQLPNQNIIDFDSVTLFPINVPHFFHRILKSKYNVKTVKL